MHKTPAKDMHTKKRGLWTERLRAKPGFRGELADYRERLGQMITTAQDKTLQISSILKEKIKEQTELKKKLIAGFKKTPEIAREKIFAKARMDLENHLHHTMRELDLKKKELKEIYHDVNCLKERIRKS